MEIYTIELTFTNKENQIHEVDAFSNYQAITKVLTNIQGAHKNELLSINIIDVKEFVSDNTKKRIRQLTQEQLRIMESLDIKISFDRLIYRCKIVMTKEWNMWNGTISDLLDDYARETLAKKQG